MTRLFLMTFHTKRRWTEDVHPHESPRIMTVPLMLLAIGSAGGWRKANAITESGREK
jgi:NADH-quinone oxidoreductase subunit L